MGKDGSLATRLAGRHEIGLPTLLFAFLGAPVAWTVHLGVVYFLVALFCTTGWPGGRTAVALATALFLVASVAAGVVAWRKWRAGHEPQGFTAALADSDDWGSLLLLMGMLGATLFSALIFFEGLAPFFVPVCSEIVS